MERPDKPRSKGRRRYNTRGKGKNHTQRVDRHDLERQANLFVDPPARPTLTREWQHFAGNPHKEPR